MLQNWPPRLGRRARLPVALPAWDDGYRDRHCNRHGVGWLCLTNLSCSYGLQLFLRLCAMSADLKGAVLRKLGDEPRWAGLRFRRELPLWLTEISAVPAYNPMKGGVYFMIS